MFRMCWNGNALFNQLSSAGADPAFWERGGPLFWKKRVIVFLSESVELDILHKIPVKGHTIKWTHLFIIWIKSTEHINPHTHCWNLSLVCGNRMNEIVVVNVKRGSVGSGTNGFVLCGLRYIGMCACVCLLSDNDICFSIVTITLMTLLYFALLKWCNLVNWFGV
jgi:hypothetical protein